MQCSAAWRCTADPGPPQAVGSVMDFIYDYISVNTFWTILFIVHALLAVALLGALTHQTMSVLMRARQAAGPAGFVTRFTAVHGPSYAAAVCVLWIATFIFGARIYAKYRIRSEEHTSEL